MSCELSKAAPRPSNRGSVAAPPPCYPPCTLPGPGHPGEGKVPFPHPAWWRRDQAPHPAGSSGVSHQCGAGNSHKSWRWLRRAPKLFAALQISRGSICLQSCTECLRSGDRSRGLGETLPRHLLGPAAASAGASLAWGSHPGSPSLPHPRPAMGSRERAGSKGAACPPGTQRDFGAGKGSCS